MVQAIVRHSSSIIYPVVRAVAGRLRTCPVGVSSLNLMFLDPFVRRVQHPVSARIYQVSIRYSYRFRAFVDGRQIPSIPGSCLVLYQVLALELEYTSIRLTLHPPGFTLPS